MAASTITRSEVASLIGEEYAGTIIGSAVAGSTVLTAFPNYNMGTKTTHIPVLATLPTATWVTDTDNTAIKGTSDVTWADKTLVAEELAVIVPVHENTLDDATEDILADIAALGGQAIGKALDQAVIFGTSKPASWTSAALLPAATSASQTYAVGTATAGTDIYGSALKAAGDLADEGFNPTSLLAALSLRFKMANLRDTDGAILLSDSGLGAFDTTYNRNGAWDASSAVALLVDPARVRMGVRQDVTVKFLDQASITDGTSVINLAERDMVALRFKARFAYVLGVGATSAGASKVPVAAVVPSDESSSSSSSAT